MRGEYNQAKAAELLKLELPPRARRIRVNDVFDTTEVGTTSACAENTQKLAHDFACASNYLRVRGEYACGSVLVNRSKELPPRARRIPNPCAFAGGVRGTTSACAENTLNELGLL